MGRYIQGLLPYGDNIAGGAHEHLMQSFAAEEGKGQLYIPAKGIQHLYTSCGLSAWSWHTSEKQESS